MPGISEQDLHEFQQLAASLKENGMTEAFIVERFGTEPERPDQRLSFGLIVYDLPAAEKARDEFLRGDKDNAIYQDRAAWIEKWSVDGHVEVLDFPHAMIGQEQMRLQP